MRRIAKQSVYSLDSKMARTLCVRGRGVPYKSEAKYHFEVFKRFAGTFACEELFPDIAWDRIASHRRQLYVKCLTAVTCLAIGQSYVESNSPVCAKTAFEHAYSDLKDCLKMEQDNRLFQQLLHKFELFHAEYAPAMQQVAE